MSERLPSRRWLAITALAALALSGCGDKYDHEPVYPVSGAVFVGDQPAAGAMVTFHPADQLDNPRARRAIATVEPDGSYMMTTYFPGDGAPPGEYVVTLNWPGELPPNASPIDVPPDRLQGRYSNPSQPFTRVTVQESENKLEPFRITP